jgi:O-glycosyl hydrolase
VTDQITFNPAHHAIYAEIVDRCAQKYFKMHPHDGPDDVKIINQWAWHNYGRWVQKQAEKRRKARPTKSDVYDESVHTLEQSRPAK